MRRVLTGFYLSKEIRPVLPTEVFCWFRSMFVFFFNHGGNKFLNQWKASSDCITTEMDETGSSVKQPRNIESEKGTVEAASNRKKMTASSTQMDKKTTKACSEDL